MAKNVWYIEFPTFQYNEDVKALASKAGLKIVDAQFYNEDLAADKTPKLTKKKSESKNEDTKKDESKNEGGE